MSQARLPLGSADRQGFSLVSRPVQKHLMRCARLISSVTASSSYVRALNAVPGAAVRSLRLAGEGQGAAFQGPEASDRKPQRKRHYQPVVKLIIPVKVAQLSSSAYANFSRVLRATHVQVWARHNVVPHECWY